MPAVSLFSTLKVPIIMPNLYNALFRIVNGVEIYKYLLRYVTDMTKNNSFSIDSAKKYLNFLEDALFLMSYDRKIYYDFDGALREQKANNNNFINWCMRNYYNNLLLKLSCFLEQPKKPDGQTIMGYIKELSKHKSELKDWCEEQTNTVMNFETGKNEEVSLKDDMLKKLNEINFNKDLLIMESFLKRIKKYRHKRIAHLTTADISKEDIPKIEDLHNIIDELQKFMTKYFHLFRISVDHKIYETGYGNFQLTMK